MKRGFGLVATILAAAPRTSRSQGTRIDPKTNAITHQYVGDDGIDAIRWGAGALWIADHSVGQLWRIDDRTSSLSETCATTTGAVAWRPSRCESRFGG